MIRMLAKYTTKTTNKSQIQTIIKSLLKESETFLIYYQTILKTPISIELFKIISAMFLKQFEMNLNKRKLKDNKKFNKRNKKKSKNYNLKRNKLSRRKDKRRSKRLIFQSRIRINK